jgi:mono/diheme cytochrome c family protein
LILIRYFYPSKKIKTEMKKIFAIAAMALLIFSCSKKLSPAKTAAKGTVETVSPVVAATTAPVTPVATAPVPAAHPEISAAITTGKATFEGNCGRCHALKNPADYTSERWVKLVDWMAPKAKLSDLEKQNVLAYLQAHAKI